MHYFVISKQKLMQKRKGVSLIELIIVLAIIGIVILLASSSHLFGLNTFSMSQEKSKNQFEVRMATDFVAKKLRYAGSIRMLSSEQTMAPTTGNYIYLTGGTLYCNEGGLQIPIPGTEGVIDFTFSSTISSKDLSFTIGKMNAENKYDVTTSIDVLNMSNGASGTSVYGIEYTKPSITLTPTPEGPTPTPIIGGPTPTPEGPTPTLTPAPITLNVSIPTSILKGTSTNPIPLVALGGSGAPYTFTATCKGWLSANISGSSITLLAPNANNSTLTLTITVTSGGVSENFSYTTTTFNK